MAIVCGPGNNGGDGFVAARVLRERGRDAVVYLAAERAKLTGDAAAHLAILERAGGVVRAVDLDAIGSAALAIDALFGVGLARPIEGQLAGVIAAINRAAKRLAIDIPSGLDADTGRTLGVAVLADRTVTMAALKIALASAPGFARCGEVTVADIGVPHALLATQAVHAGLVEAEDVRGWLPRVSALDHKGTRGHVLVIGGSPGMRGAGRLCALAALRAGAGLVTLASAGEVTADDSIMTVSISKSIAKLLEGKAAIAIGSGLGRDEFAAAWVREVLAGTVPAVIDADALALAGDALGTAHAPIVITPHPGEAARLLGTTAAAIESDRLAAARALAVKTRAVVVLKGARTIVCDGRDLPLADDFCAINPTGGPELATGGTGDVLAGVIAGLLAQGVAAVDAARAAVFIHGQAGDRLGRGMISSDLPAEIARVLARLA